MARTTLSGLDRPNSGPAFDRDAAIVRGWAGSRGRRPAAPQRLGNAKIQSLERIDAQRLSGHDDPASAACATSRPAVLRNDDHAVSRIQDRLVLLVPVHTVVLVPEPTEHLDDLPTSSGLAVYSTRFDPITYMCAACCGVCGHWLTSTFI
jgi:hypothetical protein